MEVFDDFLKLFFIVSICFFISLAFFVPVIERVEALEALHDRYICLECNSIVIK